jgi:hypothetical protein
MPGSPRPPFGRPPGSQSTDDGVGNGMPRRFSGNYEGGSLGSSPAIEHVSSDR